MKTKKRMKPTELVCEVYYKGLRKHLKEFLKEEESECKIFDVGYALDELDDLKEIVKYGRQMFNDYFDGEEDLTERKLMKPAVKVSPEKYKKIKDAVHSVCGCEDPKCKFHDEEEE